MKSYLARASSKTFGWTDLGEPRMPPNKSFERTREE
jgi:hypothetical protein